MVADLTPFVHCVLSPSAAVGKGIVFEGLVE